MNPFLAVLASLPAQSLHGTGRPSEKGLPQAFATASLRCRGDWLRTSDLLNPIFRVKAASSRRMSQMQAFWRLTDSTLHTLYADHSRKSTNSPHFPGFSVPKRAHFEVIGIDELAMSKRHAPPRHDQPGA